MDNEDILLAEHCTRLDRACDAARGWLGRNSALVGRDLEGQAKELRRAGRFFRSCAVAAERRMCVGVFGPSQAGKSYLVSGLAGAAASRLRVRVGDAVHDFLSDINPAGGKESTALVTRFTPADPLSDRQTGKQPDMPQGKQPGKQPGAVHIRLLSFTDVVKILADTYFSDAEHFEAPDRDAAFAVLDALEQRRKPAPADGISGDDVEELQEFIVGHFRGKPRVQQVLDGHFWDRAVSLAPMLDDVGRAELFGLIWDGMESFTGLLRELSAALRSLDFAAEAFCGAEALLPRTASIIDTATLGDLRPDGDDLLALTGPSGKTSLLPRVYAAALTAELIMPMEAGAADFFAHTDLLDFPGYRSRKMFTNLAEETKNPARLAECFLRGKVSYLFERYCAERELTALLLCIGGGVQEVQGLGGAVNAWIAGACGATPEARTGREKSLFFILTKGDLEFEDKAGAGDPSGRWDTRMFASTEIFGSYGWLKHWDDKGPFDNFFLMRNPTVKSHIFDHDGQGCETALREDTAAYVCRIEADFLRSKSVNEHFRFKEESWRSFISPDDGGLFLIRERLAPVCRPGLK
ncbi:MAG: putative virulence factor, partial [Desulfovibrio sp.]|nr:putative virulence factor [Desulfovibrio sp.]